MKTINLLLFIMGFTFLAMSCNYQTKSGNNEIMPVQETNEPETEAINLNNGQKWLVNKEMKPYILQAEIALNEYIQAESEDYTALAAELKVKNSGLIKSCTMKGESHDELHKWLYPHIQLIDALEKAENTADANAIIEQLNASFKTYHNYFI